MAEEIGFENGRNSNFQGLVTLTLTLNPAIRHTVVHHSSTSTSIPNFIQIEETFCGRTDGRTDGRTSPPPILLGRLLEVDLKTRMMGLTDGPKRFKTDFAIDTIPASACDRQPDRQTRCDSKGRAYALRRADKKKRSLVQH